MTKKVYVAPHFDHLDLRNEVVPFMTLSTSHCQCQCHHMTKSHVASQFNHLDLRNTLVPLMTLLASYDTDVGMIWCQYQYQWLHTAKRHVAFISNILTYGMQWCHWWCCQHHLTLMPAPMVLHDKNSCCTTYQFSWSKECNGSIDYAMGITWCQCQCQVVSHRQKVI